MGTVANQSSRSGARRFARRKAHSTHRALSTYTSKPSPSSKSSVAGGSRTSARDSYSYATTERRNITIRSSINAGTTAPQRLPNYCCTANTNTNHAKQLRAHTRKTQKQNLKHSHHTQCHTHKHTMHDTVSPTEPANVALVVIARLVDLHDRVALSPSAHRRRDARRGARVAALRTRRSCTLSTMRTQSHVRRRRAVRPAAAAEAAARRCHTQCHTPMLIVSFMEPRPPVAGRAPIATVGGSGGANSGRVCAPTATPPVSWNGTTVHASSTGGGGSLPARRTSAVLARGPAAAAPRLRSRIKNAAPTLSGAAGGAPQSSVE